MRYCIVNDRILIRQLHLWFSNRKRPWVTHCMCGCYHFRHAKTRKIWFDPPTAHILTMWQTLWLLVFSVFITVFRFKYRNFYTCVLRDSCYELHVSIIAVFSRRFFTVYPNKIEFNIRHIFSVTHFLFMGFQFKSGSDPFSSWVHFWMIWCY